ncbi:DUF1850 domain-containing protein [Nonomuraea sp. SBT364]|uniref:DUF1850 domain-containing protein n=1 Tax=Nonomuraea sp. SBT364 TaxID=1580530 RepID=UPI0018CDB979|nr:DUF1850 domain-containing protein [Nonomuraea sp. SBT364]
MLALGSGGGAGRPAVNGLALPASGVFAIGYVHSIYRAPSAEVFTADGRRFTMRAVVSASGGVLDYYALEGERRRLPGGGWLLVLAEPAAYDELRLLATPIGRRTLLAGGRCLPLHPARGAREVRVTVRLAAAGRGGSCPPPYNQSLFLNAAYSPTEASATSITDIQKPHAWPSPG